MKNNELVTISENTGFLQLADFNLDEAMASELDGLDMTFERIKIPSAGSTVLKCLVRIPENLILSRNSQR